MLKRVIFIASLALLLLGPGFVLAHEAEAQLINEESVDLGISNPGVLPGNPFYFVKELGRSLKLFFTFNSVSKARLELEIANEKAAEVKKIEEKDPQNITAIELALRNYNETQDQLRKRLEKLKDMSENPNVQELITKVGERTLAHAKLFQSLIAKFTEHEEVKNLGSEIRERMGEVVNTIKERLPEETLKPLEAISGKRCVVGGCSAELCGESIETLVSNCEFRSEYGCYKSYGRCEVLSSGDCGWAPSNELTACLIKEKNVECPMLAPVSETAKQECINQGRKFQSIIDARGCAIGWECLPPLMR